MNPDMIDDADRTEVGYVFNGDENRPEPSLFNFSTHAITLRVGQVSYC